MGNRCKGKVLNPAAMPYWANKAVPPAPKANVRAFDDLLQKPCPPAGPTMPASRPQKLSYFADMDAEMSDELAKLGRGVIFDTHGKETGFSISDVAGFAVRTGEVKKAEISVGILSKTRFLIMLPEGMAPETFIQATTPELWDGGFTFQPWSPLDEGKLVLPEYKVLLELTGLPPHFRKPNLVANAMGLFGTYLGRVPHADPANLATWRVAVAVDRLERVPLELSLNAGAVEYPINIRVCNWLRAPLYTAADLPKIPQKFSKPPKPAWNHPINSPAPFAVSRKALLEICKGMDVADLPEEIQLLLASIPEAESSLRSQDDRRRETQETADPTLEDLSNTAPTPTHVAGQTVEFQGGHTVPQVQPSPQTIQPPGEGRISSTRQVDASQALPQRIRKPVQILRRSPAKRTPAAAVRIPRRDSDREPSAQKGQATRATVQAAQKDVGQSSRGKRALPLTNTAKRCPILGPKGNPGLKPNPQQPAKRNTDYLTRPKPTTFKKVQRSRPPPQRADKAVVSQSPEGLIQVDVHYSHLAALGAGCGLPTEVVNRALEEDNLQRASSLSPVPNDLDMDLDREGPDVTFDPESGEELDSEAEVDL